MRKLQALHYEYAEDAMERRDPFRPGHLELIEKWHGEGKLAIAGALGDPPTGGLLGFDVPGTADVEEFVAADPYVKEGIVTSYRIEPWTVVTP